MDASQTRFPSRGASARGRIRGLRIASALLLLLLTPVLAPGSARGNPPLVGTIDLPPGDLGPDLTARVNQTLREELARQIVVKGGPRSPLSLAELMAAFGCGTFNIACAREVGTSLKVDQILFGRVMGTPEGWTVQLDLFSVNEEELINSARLLSSGGVEVLLWTLCRALRLVVEAPVAEISVSTDRPSSVLFLDGLRVGVSPCTMKGLLPGKHRIEAEDPDLGRTGITRELEVGPQELTITFAAQAQAAPEGETPLYREWWLWTAVGVAVAAGVATTLGVLLTRTEEGTMNLQLGGDPSGDPLLRGGAR